jgi:type II secretory pathway pseudopilin PulG
MDANVRIIRSQNGTSLLELLVALVITAVVTLAIFRTYIVQHKNYLIQEDVTEIQQSARASIEELTRQIRMAGFDLPAGMPAIEAANTDPDTITIRYNSGGCDTQLRTAMPRTSSELKVDVATDFTCYEDGDWVYIWEPDSGYGQWIEITHVQPEAFKLQHNTVLLLEEYGVGSQVLDVTQAKFYIDHTTDPDHPNLMVEFPGLAPQVYADNVSDLQFRYRMAGGGVVDDPVPIGNIREVMITVTGRSNHPDPDFPDNPYREREFATSVFVRNL